MKNSKAAIEVETIFTILIIIAVVLWLILVVTK